MAERKVNYILHLNNVFAKFYMDERLSPFHISLYFSLFQYWNIAKFKNPISIARFEVMKSCKIGSVNTYLRCLKELDSLGYIKYKPSNNPQVGSKIYLYNFNNTTNNAIDISTNTTTDKAIETHVRPYKNSTKQTINNTNALNLKDEQAKNNSEFKSVENLSTCESATSENSSCTEEKMPQEAKSFTRKFKRPELSEVKKQFEQNNWPEIEAEKFHNYFESNGWLIGGKAPMKNWVAAAKNWMINANKFQKNEVDKANYGGGKSGIKANRLHTNQSKDFGEAL